MNKYNYRSTQMYIYICVHSGEMPFKSGCCHLSHQALAMLLRFMVKDVAGMKIPLVSWRENPMGKPDVADCYISCCFVGVTGYFDETRRLSTSLNSCRFDESMRQMGCKMLVAGTWLLQARAWRCHLGSGTPAEEKPT